MDCRTDVVSRPTTHYGPWRIPAAACVKKSLPKTRQSRRSSPSIAFAVYMWSITMKNCKPRSKVDPLVSMRTYWDELACRKGCYMDIRKSFSVSVIFRRTEGNFDCWPFLSFASLKPSFCEDEPPDKREQVCEFLNFILYRISLKEARSCNECAGLSWAQRNTVSRCPSATSQPQDARYSSD